MIARLTAAAGLAFLATSLLAPRAGAQRVPFAFERIAQERGLSNGTVTAVVQGTHGFLWIGTQDGLNLYDGRGFTVYRPIPDDTTGLTDGWITALAASRGGAVWVGTLAGGVHRVDTRLQVTTHLRYRPGTAASLASDEVHALLEGRDGTVWVGTPGGVDAYDPATGRIRNHRPLTTGDSARFANDVLSMVEAPDGLLWAGTRHGVRRLDRRTGRFDPLDVGLTTREVRALLVARDGVVWIGTPDDLVAVDGRTGRVVRRILRRGAGPGSPIAGGANTLAEAPDGTIWIGGDAGVASFDPQSGRVQRHPHDPTNPRSLGGQVVRAIRFDRGGVLWVGVESHGLSKHAPAAVTFDLLDDDATRPRSLSNEYIRGISRDAAGNVWVGTQGGGLNRIDRETGTIEVHRARRGASNGLPGDNIWAFLEDRAGVSWVGLHTRGLGTYDPASRTFRRVTVVPDDASVNVLYEDRAGALHVGLEGRGLVVLSPDRRSAITYGRTLGDRQLLANDDVQTVLEDRTGALWVGGTDGLTRLDPSRTSAIRYRADTARVAGLRSTFVTNIIEDRRGVVWVATKGGGLHRFDQGRGRFTAFGTTEGLPHNFVYGVLEDARGRLWITTDDGIARFDPLTLLVTRYGLEDGLQAREFNRRAHFRADDGTMYVGGINGLNIFNPDRAAASSAPLAVSLVTLATRDGAPRPAIDLTADSVVRLRHDGNAFTISYAALDFTAPEKIQYAYRLDGVDRDWVLAGNRHQATYASVPTGRHVFRVMAAGSDGVWSPAQAAMTLVVTPAWWATWWARSLQLLALGLLIVGGTRLRLRAVRRRGDELEMRVLDQTRDLVAAQAGLRESLERERAAARELVELTDAVPGAVFQLRAEADGTRAFVFVSDGVAALFPADAGATTRPEDPRRAAEALLARVEPDDRVQLEQTLEISRATLEDWQLELQWSPGDGLDTRWVAIQAHPAREADDATVWTGVITDATDARRAEAERLALESRILQAQKGESLAVLAGGIAHDFNNILVSVVVGAELLEYQIGENARAAETVRRIRVAGQRAADLTNQMLAYAGRGRLSMQQVNLATLVDEMVTLVRATVPRTIDIAFRSGPVPAVVKADATQLRQIVMNLVTNAGEAIGDRAGRVLVHVDIEHRPAHELSLRHHAPDMPREGPYVLLEVADDGAGMDETLLERIFDPFFTTKFTGRGLGLAALLGIVRTHHGGVNVDSAVGHGTRFLIYLPLAEGAADDAAVERAGPSAAVAPTRVLVADDELDVREISRGLLEALGYEAILAEDGESALEIAGREPVDLFLLDVTMPKMNGASVARILRERGMTQPIVLMSGYTEEDLMRRGVTVDADAFLKKPFLAAELSEALRAAQRAAASTTAPR